MEDPLSYFSIHLVLHNWCNKDIYYLVCGMVHKKDPLLLFEKNSQCIGGSGFPLLLLVVLCHMSDAI